MPIGERLIVYFVLNSECTTAKKGELLVKCLRVVKRIKILYDG